MISQCPSLEGLEFEIDKVLAKSLRVYKYYGGKVSFTKPHTNKVVRIEVHVFVLSIFRMVLGSFKGIIGCLLRVLAPNYGAATEVCN